MIQPFSKNTETSASAQDGVDLSGQSENADSAIRPGRYRHFKGGEYRVLCMAKHSETAEPMVVYQALYGAREIWVRPASMWREIVKTPSGEVLRFTPVELAEEP